MHTRNIIKQVKYIRSNRCGSVLIKQILLISEILSEKLLKLFIPLSEIIAVLSHNILTLLLQFKIIQVLVARAVEADDFNDRKFINLLFKGLILFMVYKSQYCHFKINKTKQLNV